MNSLSTRREFLKNTSLAGIASLPLLSSPPTKDKTLKIICVGAHPDDPESGCGGTLARYSATGHTVKIFYLTRGEAGIEGSSIQRLPLFELKRQKKRASCWAVCLSSLGKSMAIQW